MKEGFKHSNSHTLLQKEAGFGYNLSQGSGKQNLIWMRPKVYWEVPHWELSTYSFALQLGFTHTISSRQ